MRIDITDCEPGNCPVKMLAVDVEGHTNGNGLVIKHGDVIWSSAGHIRAIRGIDDCYSLPVSCTVEILAFQGGVSVAADDDNVYFTDYGDENAGTGRVLSVPLAGGPMTTIATGGSQTWDVHTDGAFVYYGNQAWQQPAIAATIDRVPVNNPDPSTHVNIATGRELITSETIKVFGIDATDAYYIDTYDRLMRAPLDGSGAVEVGRVVANSCPQGNIAIKNRVVYWTDTCLRAVHFYVLP
jgi:hypothetical protein